MSRRGVWTRLRADLRLARRQVWRARASSTLVALLVALPVAGLAGAAVFWQSHVPTAEQRADLELGAAESWIQAVGGPDPSRRQAVDEPWSMEIARDENGVPEHPELPTPESAATVIPATASVIEVHEYGSLFVETGTGVGRVPVTTGSMWDPVFAGRYEILSGAAPTRPEQAMVSPGLLARLGARVGDDVVLTDSARTFTISGTMRQLDQRAEDDMLFLPASAAALVPDSSVRWFVADWQPDVAELGAMNRAGFIAFARDLVVHPPAGANTVRASSGSEIWMALVVGSIAAVFCGYLVVLLAGAAFAVAARRQQRSLAVASSVGAGRGDVFRIVVLQGTVLGLVGGIVGAAAGIGAAALLLALTDDGVRGSFWGNWGLRVPWILVALALVFAVLVGTLSALAPARGATRGDVLGALRGSRRPAKLQAKRPLWGLGMMILGLTTTIAGALVIAALNSASSIDYSHPLRAVALYGIVAGPIVFQIGILLAGHWTLTAISRVLSHWGLAPRLAGRDAAANPSRVVPAFAAIAACVFIASFVLSTTALTTAASNRSYSWNGPEGSVGVAMWGQDASESAEAVATARSILEPSAPAATALVSQPPDAPYDPRTGRPVDPDFPVWAVQRQDDLVPEDCDRCDPRADFGGGSLQVIAPDDLETVLAQAIPAPAMAAFRDGALLSLASWSGSGFERDGIARIGEWTTSGFEAYNTATQEYWQGSREASNLPAPTAVREVPAVTVDLKRPQGWLQTVISPDTARALGIEVVPRTLYAVYPEPPGDDVVDALTSAVQNARIGEAGVLTVTVERGPAPAYPWLWLICGVAVVLVVGAGAICLGLARFERRPDDATLTAVGAGRGIRRRVNAWQAAILVGVGTIVGTVAGLIPVWGISQSSADYLRFADSPWLWLGILALGLPVVMTLASWLVPPRHPDLTRRTAIA